MPVMVIVVVNANQALILQAIIAHHAFQQIVQLIHQVYY